MFSGLLVKSLAPVVAGALANTREVQWCCAAPAAAILIFITLARTYIDRDPKFRAPSP